LSTFDAFASNYRQLVNENIRITGESSDYFAAYKADYIARRVASRATGKLLDYGCGVGLLCGHLKGRLPKLQIDGFDISQDSVARVDKTLQSQGIFTSNLEELGHAYDFIVLSNVLHHVEPEERSSLLEEACSRLASGGKLVVFEHNPINPLTRWAVSQCTFDEGVILLPSSEPLSYFRRVGFQVLRRDYIVFFPRWLRWLRPLETRLGWFPLGAQYVVVAGS
jgi:2-polyprenyl-3-methyl-5-hydroxy-6-metoxy-1,4-benzoquinol methylase